MSGKKQKILRKLAREELEKRMNPNGQRQQSIEVQVIRFLEEYIQLSISLTGIKPTAITLTDAMYNSYIQESQRHAEILGLKPGFKDDQPLFSGVKIEKKSPIIVPTEVNPPPAN